MSMDYLGERVRFARKQRGLTAIELGERVGVTQGHISKLENSNRQPTTSLIRSLAKELGVREAWLIEGVGSMYETKPEPIYDKEVAESYVSEILRALNYELEQEDKENLVQETYQKLRDIRGFVYGKLIHESTDRTDTIKSNKSSDAVLVRHNIIEGDFSANGDVLVGGNKIVTAKHTTRTLNTPPPGSVSEAQAQTIRSYINALGEIESKRLGFKSHGLVTNQFKKKFGVTSYKNIPSTSFDEAIKYLERRIKISEKEALSKGLMPIERNDFIKRIQTICRIELRWTDPIRREKLRERYGKTSLADLTMTQLEDFYKYVGGIKRNR